MVFTATITLPEGLEIPSTNEMYTWKLGKAYKRATVVRFEQKVSHLFEQASSEKPAIPDKIPLRLDLLLQIHNAGKRDIDNHTKSLIDAIASFLGINDNRFYDFVLKKRLQPKSKPEEITITVELL